MKRRRVALAAVLVVLCIPLAGFLLGACVFNAPAYRGPVSDHFDGSVFKNDAFNEGSGLSGLLRWQMERERGEWPEWQDGEPAPSPPERVDDGSVRITMVNHATLLIQQDGVNILTDPVWSERTSPVTFAGPYRRRPPGVRFEDLPPIDVIVISHNHYDHLDTASLARLVDAHHPKILVPLGNQALLDDEGIVGSKDSDWWDATRISDRVVVTNVPAQHFSGRGMSDRMKTLFSGWVIDGPSGRVFFAGDTGYGPHFTTIREKTGAPDVALLPIGAFRPEWFMRAVHTDPADAVRAHLDLGAQFSMGMHFGTFPLADDGMEEPVVKLAEARTAKGIEERVFVAPKNGESFVWRREEAR
jgi:L-ascorbate metabolism protein UlaG (beta-lactamase superfamily)